jgi:hypothetical protein
MSDPSSSSTWPSNRPSNQCTLEMLAHITYRDAIMLINPDIPLPDDCAQRFRALRLGRHKRPVKEGYINELREMAKGHDAHGLDFYTEHMTTCFNITVLVSRLENMRDFQKDMKARLESRLRSVHILRKWDERDKVWVWVLELNEDVPEGLRRGEAKPIKQNKTGAPASGFDNGGAMEIDG